MGVSFYPRIENTSDDWTRQVSGKALAREYEVLTRLVKKQGLRDLMTFYVPDKEEWFNSMEGIGIIEAMLRVVKDRRSDFEGYERLKDDLEDFHSILDKAASIGKRWNLAMDT